MLGAIEWLPADRIPPRTVPLQIIPTLRYKVNASNEITARKVRYSIRGDKMLVHIHYDPNKLSMHSAHHYYVRIILEYAAKHNIKLRYIYFNASLIHDKISESIKVFVVQPRRFNGSSNHTYLGRFFSTFTEQNREDTSKLKVCDGT